jgi:hypothetical protein
VSIAQLHPEFVDLIPEAKVPGTLYVSIEYATAVHLCCCGCGEKVVTPLSPTDWRVTYDGENASLYPSVGNWSLPCRSHYWVDRGRVVWAPTWSHRRIEAGRRQSAKQHDRRFEPDLAPPKDTPVGCLRAWLARSVIHPGRELVSRSRKWTSSRSSREKDASRRRADANINTHLTRGRQPKKRGSFHEQGQ